MTNWFVGAFFVALGLIGLVGLYAVAGGMLEGLWLLPLLGASGWYLATRYEGTGD